ncbi:MAG: restriction endonuclease [Candidatus Aminicenantes bacterium]|nr:restriction endonuclease [Candidatus Aminicenantes bacterium]
MNTFSFDHLNGVEFEEFCYELLSELGVKEINWRKGSGLNASPSDSGRDIECAIEKNDIDGITYKERWFVECKHYRKGIPVEKIQGILSWAQAENPDVILVIVSNFLSNRTKDYLEKYKETNKPKFKVKVWEKPDLEKLCSSKARLLNKYKIPNEFSYISLLHPAHLLYLKEPPFNSLDYFLALLDKMDALKRDEALGWAFPLVIRPRYKDPVTGKETFRELLIDDVSYDSFKKKCIEIRNTGIIDEGLLVLSITSFVLSWLIKQGDVYSIEDAIESSKDLLAQFKKDMIKKPEKKERLEKLIRSTEERIKNIPNNIKQTHELYNYFCMNVVGYLLVERIFSLQKE